MARRSKRKDASPDRPKTAKTYTIKGTIICAEGLTLREGFGTVNPYSVVSLAGSKLYHSTPFFDDSRVPFWEDDFEFQSRGSPANDLLRFYIYSKDNTDGHGPLIGVTHLFIREVPFGVESTHRLGLHPADAKGRPSGFTYPGSAGYVYVRFLILQQSEKRAVEWSIPLWDFQIQFTSFSFASGGNERRAQQSCVFAKLVHAQNKQRFKSKWVLSRTPVWKGKHVFAVGDVKHDVVAVRLLQQDDRKGEVRVGKVVIPIPDFRPGARYEIREYRITDGDRVVGTLQVKAGIRPVLPAKVSTVTLPTRPKHSKKSTRRTVERPFDSAVLYTSQDGSGRRPIKPDTLLATQDGSGLPRRGRPAIATSHTAPGPRLMDSDFVIAPSIVIEPNFDFERVPARVPRKAIESPPVPHVETVDLGDFNWGDGGSELSTSFTGYSGKGTSLSEGPIAADESGTAGRIIVRKHFLKGTVISAHGLGSGMKFLVVDLVGRKRPKGKREVSESFVGHDKDDIALDFDFGEVKKGWSLEVALGIKHTGVNDKIGVARIPIKDIEVDASDPVQIQLLDPEKGQLARGDLLVELKHHID